ncbi:uncharacterized protein LOC108739120 [Agrilus planipennis]|uniref:Uncharacterized protein LOC108739120 n=1 Tax=Agrilus planipennis TaxID=224129 RepID=A0A1W4X6A3_AGRPL|nr:uncharacterized protein LOC108739120 [Agrilus planipennis]XP_018328357.1 uncharacterized protein LOC108739120 [Agrilus planipennis]XP_018328358.1 uncharacterized protein LOC108739120 [Agrilus planipennis]XP_018328359.1 uncharacterized protein LOC108739120 [Agrilus planipennis]
MSAICQNFVQNAWKKELCSNCFKSKDEHVEKIMLKPIALKSEKVIASIIKKAAKISKTKRTVSFTAEVSKVIGYGGEDWSDNDDDFMSSEDTSEDNEYEADGEEEKELQRITKANTDFNTINANLLNDSPPDTKKSFASLKLGTPQVDSTGKKQTLLVSVTPFGEDNSTPTRKYTKTVSQIPVAKTTKDTVQEHKKNVILTSYNNDKEEVQKDETEKSLLEEISETLEKGGNRISIMDCKLTENVPETKSPENSPAITPIIIDKNLSATSAVIKTNENNNVEQSGKPIESKPKINACERKVLLTRAPVIKRSTAKLELFTSKNLKLRSSKENLTTPTVTNIIDSKDLSKNEDNVENDSGIEKHSDSEESNKADSTTTDTDNYEDVSASDTNNSLTESLKDEEMSKKYTKLSTTRSLENIKEPGSRELAGEPDGHADPDGNNDVPALPSTPPPFETRSSFLHGPGSEKPKPPGKPATVLIRKPVMATNQHVGHQNILTTFSVEPPKSPVEPPLPSANPITTKIVAEHPKVVSELQKSKLSKQDSTGSDYGRTTNKRRAPMPPPTEESNIYSKKTIAPYPDDSHKDRTEIYNSSIYNEIGNGDCNEPQLARYVSPPDVGPRRTISLSSDNLTSAKMDDKKKEKAKQRFSLKKFLRMNSSNKEFITKDFVDAPKQDSQKQNSNSKQRLVIVHPSELNGEKIEVVAKPVIPPEITDYSPLNTMQNGIYNSTASLHASGHPIYENRSFKPAPPPRNLELYGPTSKPSLPHPPKPHDPSPKQKNARSASPKSHDSVYANIGEVRSSITPHKPQRTASMREREVALALAQKHKTNGHLYEPINLARVNGGSVKDANENVYDYINGVRSSSPEFDSPSSPTKNSPVANTGRLRKSLGQVKSSSNIDVSGEGYKYNAHIPRSASLTYCGSETESEIYSPYGLYGSEGEIFDDDREWTMSGSRTHKLRSRKGRSIVHKNLEDNYGAVVVANHEALAQVLENITHVPTVMPALRGLKAASSLRWSDFTLIENSTPLLLGPRVFYQALWGSQHVTLVISKGTIPSSSLSLGNFNLIPITEFVDLVPVQDVPSIVDKDSDNCQATIAVHPWMQVHSIKTYSELLKSKSHSPDDSRKDAYFVLLQLVNALKMLQAQGIEELPDSLTTFVLCREMDKEMHHRLCILQGFGEDSSRNHDEINFVSLCNCAGKALLQLMPDFKLTSLLGSLLNNERAISLTQVKSVLEFSLWGPSDVVLSMNIRERELALQRWLDLQRATVLHGLVCTKVKLTVYEECHLLFLVRSNSKMICDASLLIESAHMQSSISKV